MRFEDIVFLAPWFSKLGLLSRELRTQVMILALGSYYMRFNFPLFDKFLCS